MGNKLQVSPSPHVRGKGSTSLVMLCVICALLPSCVYGVINFGTNSLLILLVSVASAVLSELIYELIMRKEVTVTDLSAVVTGLLLGMNMPPTIKWWIPAIGSAFAIIVVKQLFGGLGRNFMNPALAARCFLVIIFSAQMTTFQTGNGALEQARLQLAEEQQEAAEAGAVSDIDAAAGASETTEAEEKEKVDASSAATAEETEKVDAFSAATAEETEKVDASSAAKAEEKEKVAASSAATAEAATEAAAVDAAASASETTEAADAGKADAEAASKKTITVDAVSTATPMAYLKKGYTVGIKELFFGNTKGTIGETSALLILIGGLFLMLIGVIDWRIPVCYLGSFFVLTWLTAAARGYSDPALFALDSLLAGGIMLGAWFMATDYVSSPITHKGRIIFAVILGIITWLYRMFGIYKEGVSNAIILANCLVPLIDRFTRPAAFGVRSKNKGKEPDRS